MKAYSTEKENRLTANKLFQLYDESCFIYPSKSATLKPFMEEILSVWDKLMNSQGELANVFYRENERKVLSSVCTVRYSPTDWLIQHAAGIHDPLGVRDNLIDITQWLNHQQTCKYVSFIFRPDNTWPAKIFSGLAKHLGPQHHASRDLIYGFVHLFSDEPVSEVRIVNSAEKLEEITSRINEKIHPFIKESEGFSNLPEFYLLQQQFKSHGLDRQREIMVVGDSQPCAAAVLDYSSLGMNLSFFFNKAQLFYFSGNPQEVGNILLQGIKRYYSQRGRSFAVLVADSHDPLSSAIPFTSFHVKKNYNLLTFPNKGDCFPQGIEYFREYYKHIERRLKNNG